jgi:putative transposase
VLTAQGMPVDEAVRSIGVTEVTSYRLRQEYGCLKSDQVKRLKDLKTEKCSASQGSLGLDTGHDNPARGCQGKLLSPARRRACIEHVRDRFACL